MMTDRWTYQRTDHRADQPTDRPAADRPGLREVSLPIKKGNVIARYEKIIQVLETVECNVY